MKKKNNNLSLADIEEQIKQVNFIIEKMVKKLENLKKLKEYIKDYYHKDEVVEKVLVLLNENTLPKIEPDNKSEEVLDEIKTVEPLEKKTETNKLKDSELPKDIFKGVTAHRSIILYLEFKKKGQTIREITDALIQGGYITKAKQLYDNIRPILTDHEYPKGNADFVRIGKNWELAKWHNEEFLQQFRK